MKIINIIVLLGFLLVIAGCCDRIEEESLKSVSVGSYSYEYEGDLLDSLSSENINFTAKETIYRYLIINKYANVTNATINFTSVNITRVHNISDNGQADVLADCYVNSQFPDTPNNGTSMPIYVDALGVRRGFIRFNLSKIPENSTIISATLLMQQRTSSATADVINISFVADDSWQEDEVTWNTMPTTHEVLGDTTLSGAVTWELFNLTEYNVSRIQTEYSGDGLLSLDIRWGDEVASRTASFAPKDEDFGNTYPPTLQIEYVPQLKDVYLDVGNDSAIEWNYSGWFQDVDVFVTNITNPIINSINNASCNCTGCSLSGDNCSIPFRFYSETEGTLRFEDFNVTYQIDEEEINISIYLDGLNESRKYEWQTTANISAYFDCLACTVCIDLPALGYGENYVCGEANDGFVEFNYTVGYALRDEFNDTLKSKNLNFTNTIESYLIFINMSDRYIDIAQFGINGTNNTEGFPQNITIDILGNGSADFMSTGFLNGTKLQNNQFTNKLDSENIIYSGAGSKQRYLNYSVNDQNLFSPYAVTFNLTGGKAMEEGINFKDLFWNSTNINLTQSNVTHAWVWEDFSLGDITGRWTGSYTITLDTKIETNSYCSCTGVGDCEGGSNTDSDNDQFYSQTLDLGDYSSVFVEVYLYGIGYYSGNPCTETASGSGSAVFSIRDKTSGVSTPIKNSAGATSGVGDASSSSNTDSSIWEIRKDGSKLKFYDDGVYSDEMDYDSEHQYEVRISTDCGCTARKYNAGGTGTGRITYLNASGITGTKIDDFTWTNSTTDSLNIMNFSTNVTAATLTATTNIPFGTNVIFYMSTTNGYNLTNTTEGWEEVQSGVGHEFIMHGTNLSWRANITTTDIQDDDGDQSEMPIIYDVQIEVSSGYPENITVDFGYDGVIDWNMSGDMNENESEIVVINSSVINNYIYQNCENDLTCKVPISIYSASGGMITYSDLSADLEIKGINLNPEMIIDYLSGCDDSCNVTFNVSSTAGLINVSKINFTYIGEENYTVLAHILNYGEYNRSINLVTRYSPINVSYPLHIPGYYLMPRNLTQYNVTPYGQEIRYCNYNNYSQGYCENVSIPIFNVTSLAKTDPIEVYVKLNQTFECINISVDDDINVTGSIILTNLTGNSSLIESSLDAGSTQGIYSWANLYDCNRSKLAYFDVQFYFETKCEECVMTNDVFTD